MLKYDNHHIEDQFNRIKAILIKAEEDMQSFIGPVKSKLAGRRFTVAMNKVRKYSKEVRKSALRQREEHESSYDNL